jgi:cell division protease FtsH
MTRSRLIAKIRHILGGRAAEKLVFGHLSTGAADDLAQATRAARGMVCRFGMNERIGPVYYDQGGENVFLGRDLRARRSCSEKKAAEIEFEVARMLRELYEDALARLDDHRALLDRIAEALLERETLDQKDLAALLAD